MARHQSGKLDEAEGLYSRILANWPDHPDALHLLGVIRHQTGRHRVARELIQKAVRIMPDNPVFIGNLGAVCNALGQLHEAEACFRKAADIQPDNADAHNNLGMLLSGRGETDAALACFREAIRIRPENADVCNNMGITLKKSGRLDEAVSCYQKAVAIRPDFFQAFNNLGNAYKELGRIDASIPCYKKALELNPGFADAMMNMGIAYQTAFKFREAVACHGKALAMRPGDPSVLYNLGLAMKDMGRLDEAKRHLETILARDPNHAGAHSLLGVVHSGRREWDRAIFHCRQALRIDSEDSETHHILGGLYQELGRFDEAIGSYARAFELNPKYTHACCSLVLLLRHACRWDELAIPEKCLDELTQNACIEGKELPETPFVGVLRKDDPARCLAIATAWAGDTIRRAAGMARFPGPVKTVAKNKIAVAYLSHDFRDHPVGHLTASMFGRHDRNAFEIFCYSTGENDGSPYRRKIESEADRFADIGGLAHADAARKIAGDHPDIFVDLTGFTSGGRPEISALCPAPVRVGFLGFPGTAGPGVFDYLVADKTVIPEEHDSHYSEKIVYMPGCYLITDDGQAISDTIPSKAECGLPETGVVFCSFNQGYKIEPVLFDVWMAIMREAAGSVLWLLEGDKAFRANLGKEAEKRGVPSDRLIFATKVPSKADHLARLSLADIALDTRVFNGHATTADALWAGVPVVALQGGHFASRVSSSLLAAAGLPDFVAKDPETYRTLAIELANSPEKRVSARKRLAENRTSGTLFDTQKYVRNLETAYREMVKRHRAGKGHSNIHVDACNEE